MAKIRLDVRMTELGLAESRQKAQAIIMSGQVYVNDQKQTKAGAPVTEEDKIEVRGKTLAYVSRGGLKLEKAMKRWPIDLKDAVCADIGASTGGFTDCMLQNGASKVFSVDVGHGQLAWKLRNDPRVVCMEKTNFRYVTMEQIGEQLDFASCDVSFISLTKILIPARNLLKNRGEMVCLIKPQFEAGKDKVGKKGVVREPEVHREVVEKILDYADMIGFDILHLEYSPIKGPEGNIEYLVHLSKNADKSLQVEVWTEKDAEAQLMEVQVLGKGISSQTNEGNDRDYSSTGTRCIGLVGREAYEKGMCN